MFDFKRWIGCFALFLLTGIACGQEAPQNKVFRFLFRVSDSQLMLSYGSNKQQTALLDSLVGAYGVTGIKSVTLAGVCSPDGRLLFNDQVSYLRAQNLRQFLVTRYVGLERSLIRINEQGDNFVELIREVSGDRSFPRRGEVLDAMTKNPDKEGRQFALLGLLSLPDVRFYAQENLYPKLRYAYLCDVEIEWSAPVAKDTIVVAAAPVAKDPVVVAAAPVAKDTIVVAAAREAKDPVVLAAAPVAKDTVAQDTVAAPVVVFPSYVTDSVRYQRVSHKTEALVGFAPSDSWFWVRYDDNQTESQKLDAVLWDENLLAVDSVLIESINYVGGTNAQGSTLWQKRIAELSRRITTRYVLVDPLTIRSGVSSNRWEYVVELIRNDSTRCPRSSELLFLLSSDAMSDAQKEEQLLRMFQLDRDVAYYWSLSVLPVLERRYKVTVYSTHAVFDDHSPVDSLSSNERAVKRRADEPTDSPYGLVTYVPKLALKTNLLFDLASAVNLELSVSLGRHWSIGLEGIFPQWIWGKGDKSGALQLLSGTLEGRYWFRPIEHNKWNALPYQTGWFLGVYGMAGYGDAGWNGVGVQSRLFWSAGLSGGFAHPIGKQLRMEYALGVGFFQADYQQYKMLHRATTDEWVLAETGSGVKQWIGPTQLKVSLVWMIQGKSKKK